MIRSLALLALAAAGLAIAASTGDTTAGIETPTPAGMEAPRTAGMGAPASAGWGSGMEPTPMPAAPHVPQLPWLQTLVDLAPAGSVLKPPPGSYSGPVVVNKPLIIDGGGQVTVDGGGRGTVFVLEANNAALRGLRLTNSGGSHDSDDACLNVRGSNNLIEALVIDDCLFGIDLKRANDNVVRGNRISSKPVDLGMRGDGLRLWYSMNNRIEGNEVIDSRDMVAWYSNGNLFKGNVGRRSRYSIHFMFANQNLVEDNRFYDNAVGVYLMYTEGTHVRNNVFSHATGAAGMGLGFKEASDAVIEGNEIIYCAVGIGSDISPFQPGSKIELRNNRIAYNGVGVLFTSELGGNVFTDNVFEGNISHVAYAGGTSKELNEWRGNHWDDYAGFDRDGDGVGDTPYQLHAYADTIWMEIPQAAFFRSSPALELLDFLERLAPFSTPNRMLRDEAPRFDDPMKKAARHG